jgi:hypothetical protein
LETRVTAVDDLSAENNRVQRTITVGTARLFDSPRELEVLAGALRKVWKFDAPEKHFSRRRLIGLFEEDYHAIVDYRQNVSRSIFRRFYAGLPRDIQAEFMRANYERLREELDFEGRVESYVIPSKLLLTFIDDRIRTTLALMRRISDVHSSLANRMGARQQELPPLSTLVLSDSISGDDEADFGAACVESAALFSQGAVFGLITDRSATGENVGSSELTLIDEAFSELAGAADEEGNDKWLERPF